MIKITTTTEQRLANLIMATAILVAREDPALWEVIIGIALFALSIDWKEKIFSFSIERKQKPTTNTEKPNKTGAP